MEASPPEGADPGRAAGMVRARGVRFAYGRGAPVLDGVDLDVGVGETVALVGPKGSGKSTLLRLFAGDLQPLEGELDLPGARTSGGRAMLGYSGRTGAHFEPLTGWQNAIFFARAGGLRRAEAEQAVTELMQALGLFEHRDRPVSSYSFSERRKLLLVEALAHRPALTLLDKPFAGLAQAEREALIHALRLSAAKRGTVIVASDDLVLIPELVDRLLFMHRGRVVAQGRVAELLASVGSSTRIEIDLDRRPQSLDARFRPGVTVVSDADPFIVETARGAAVVGEVTAALVAAGATVRSVRVREADLAEVFRRAAGAELDA